MIRGQTEGNYLAMEYHILHYQLPVETYNIERSINFILYAFAEHTRQSIATVTAHKMAWPYQRARVRPTNANTRQTDRQRAKRHINKICTFT